jgi:regulatory protein
MALVTDVSAPRRGSRLRVVSVDHSEWRTTSSDVLKAVGVRTGHVAPEDELSAAIAHEEPARARERAMRLLTYRERSSAEVAGRLTDDGYPLAVVDAVVADLQRAGLLDDARFVQVMARVLTQVRGMGRSRALRELASKGIDVEMARDALEEALPPEAEREAAHELAAALASRPRATVDRVAARLLRKGYAPSIALECAKRAVSDHAAEHAGGDIDADAYSTFDLHESGD